MAVGLDSWGDSIVSSDDTLVPLTGSTIYPDRYRGNNLLFNGSTHDLLRLDTRGTLALFQAVERCSPLSSIISKLSSAYANGKVEVLNRNTLKYVRGQYKDYELLLDEPNKYQSKTDFRKQLYAYTKINGWCYVLPEYSTGFTDKPIALHILLPWMIEVEPLPLNRANILTGKTRRLWFCWGGERIELNEEELILFKDTTTDIDRDTLLPRSRIIPHVQAVSNVVAVGDAENNLVTKRGGIGFISSDSGGKDSFGSSAITPDEKTDFNNEFIRANGITGNRAVVAITTAFAKWNPMAFNVQQLMLIEIDDNATGKLCDAFGYPFFLMSNGKSGTFNNVGEAEKSLYQNTIIPDAVSLDEQMNKGLKAQANNILIQTDYSHIDALQESKQEAAVARKTNDDACLIEWEAGLISLNEWRDRNGDDIIGKKEEVDTLEPKNPYNMRKPQYDKWKQENDLMPVIDNNSTFGNNNAQDGQANTQA